MLHYSKFMKPEQYRCVILYCVLILLFSLVSEGTSGQPYYFRHYQVENGLSNNTVFCSVQDRHGFIWLGTKDGLDRFDGYSFKEFRNLPGINGLGDSFIRSMFLDTSGKTDTLYLGTRIGVYQFDPITEHFSLLLKTKGEVNAILKDQSGHLWSIADKTLIRLNLADHTRKVYDSQDYFQATSLCVTVADDVWVSTADGQICKYNPDAQNKMDIFARYDLFKGHPHQSPRWIEKIFITRQGLILAGTSNFGVRTFDPTTAKTGHFLDTGEYAGIFVRDFAQVSDSSIWIATESGVFIDQLGTGELVNLRQKTGDPYSLSDNAVYTLCRDQEGGIWAGTYSGGVNYYPRQYNSFHKYFAGQGTNSLKGNVVREIIQDKNGQLWIGTEDGGLNRLNTTTNQIQHYLAEGKSTDIAYPNIHGLLAIGDTLLVGTFEHGLDLMDCRSGKVFAHFPEQHKPRVLRSSFMVTFCHTQDGTIYAGTRLGLYQFNPETGHFSSVFPQLANAFIHSIQEDKNRRFWIGTMGNGLYCYDPKTGRLRHYQHSGSDSSSISNNWITIIFQDSHNAIWIGTEGGGLCRLLTGEGGFVRYTSINGLPSNTIYKILEDDAGFLWMSTSRGLVRFESQTGSMTIFTTANGLLSDQFNYNSGFKDKQGKMYFGSVKGLISFNPNTFKSADFVPPLYITEIQAAGEPVASWGDLILHKPGSDYAQIDVPHRRSSLSIEFAALSYTAPKMTQYQYILEGLDDRWTYLTSNRKVYFTNLAPGKYTFRVRATNSSGKWNGREAVLAIEILPTFWESRLAYALYILIAAGIAYFLFRNYHDRIAEKNKRRLEQMAHEKEKELYEAKLDFFAHVTHEIKTPLTLIKAPLEKILLKIDAYPGIRKYILMMQRNTGRMEDLSGQLLDFRKIEVDGFRLNHSMVNIHDLLRDILVDFKPPATEKGLKVQLTLSKIPLTAYVDKEAVTKIITNLVDNAVKYARSFVHIMINIYPQEDEFSISVENDGVPIPFTLQDKIFEPFFRMGTAKGLSGAGLGLALSRSLASLQNGSLILLESTADNIIFVLRLPINKTPISDH